MNIQKEIDRLNKRGYVFGLTWFMGIGSVIALISAFQSYNLFKANAGKVDYESLKFIRRNFIIGLIGMAVWIPVIILLANK